MANGITYKTVLTEKAYKFFTHRECELLKEFLLLKTQVELCGKNKKGYEGVRTHFKNIREKLGNVACEFIIQRCFELQLMALEIVTDEAEDKKQLLAIRKPFWEEKKKVS